MSNRDRSTPTGEWEAAAPDAELMTREEIEETMDFFARLLVVPGLSEWACRFLAALCHALATEAQMTAEDLTAVDGGDTVPRMNRLQELLARRELRRGRDDAELDELGRLLQTYRRVPGPWVRCEVEGRTGYRRELDCGHAEFVECKAKPRGGIIVEPDGTEREIPLSAVCHTCYQLRAESG